MKKQRTGKNSTQQDMTPFNRRVPRKTTILLVLGLVCGIGLTAFAADSVLQGHITKTTPPKDADLVSKYGEAANLPEVTAAIRKLPTEDKAGAKAASDRYEALQNGASHFDGNPIMGLLYSSVPPNMPPEEAAILAKHLPKLPIMPRPRSPEQMAREPQVTLPVVAEPMPQVPGDSRPGSIAAANQNMIEGYLRDRLGPVHIPPLQRDHGWLAQHAKKTSGRYIVESDHQSVVGVCDASGNEITSIQYDPWGNMTVLHGGTVMPDFGFQGMYWHDRSKNYLTLNRVYNPALGRWLSRDPLGETAGANLYAFVGNNPINRRDPLGLFVTVNYSESTGVLSAVDSDTGQAIVVNNGLFSGDAVGGPATPGPYYILPENFAPVGGGQSLAPFYPLAQINDLMRLSTTYGNGRSGFEIHPGNISHGCVTFKHQPGSPVYPFNSDFNALENLLNNTSTLPFHGLGQSTVNIPGVIYITP